MRDIDKTFRELVNKMLEPHGVDYDFVIANPKIDGEDWYNHYKWTDQQEKDFEKWATAFLKRRHKWNEKLIEKELSWFTFAYGLKKVEE